ncbi:TSC22 domain family protein 2 isoform X3 [Sorex araneus]|uniref:TSC22 domain family protein 2 isoform X3 n=1 Tax=Sorex araneus TaxID=42254 RepID=UPI002433FEB1|nr:TSC22 domain family protein 2 isoform X3 [Sorex araneus]
MSKMPAKKKSCFQITSVTTAQVATSITEDTESLDDPDESRTEDVSSEIFDVSRATDYGPEEACERSSSEETLNNVGEAETPGAVSPNLPPDGPLAPANGAGRAAAPAPPPPAAAAAAACSSRFRVIKLDHGSGEPYRRGRWTCVEYYERDADSSVLARSGDCIRHSGPPEPAAERDSGLGATGGSVVVVVTSLPGPHGPEPGPDGAPPAAAAAERTSQPGPAPPPPFGVGPPPLFPGAPAPGPPPGSAVPAGPLGAGPPLATVTLAQPGAPTTAQPPPPFAYPQPPARPPPPAGPSAPLLPGDPGGAGPPPTVPAPPPGGSGALAAAPGAANVPAAAPAPSVPSVPAAPLAMPNVPAPPPPASRSGGAAPAGPPPSDPSPPAAPADEARRPSEPLPQPPLALLADSKPAAKPAADALAHPLQLTPMGSLATSVFSIAIPVDGDEDRNPSTAFYQAFHVNTFQESKSLWDRYQKHLRYQK